MNAYVLARIDAIQEELKQLKKAVAHQAGGAPKQETKLKGLWKGVQVDDEDIAQAQRSVFRGAYRFEG